MRSRFTEIAIERMGDYAAALDDLGYLARKKRPRFASRVKNLRKLESVLTIGNYLFEAVELIARNWRDEVMVGKTDYHEEEDRSIRDLYRQWAQPCRRCLQDIAGFRKAGMPVVGATSFKQNCEKARKVISGEAAAFTDPEIEARWATFVSSVRPNPRPVRVDEQGRIYEVNGDRLVIPGLEPESILRGIADIESGRVRPLKDVVARRA